MGGVDSIALVLKSMNCLFLFALLTDIGSQQLKTILPSSMGVMILARISLLFLQNHMWPVKIFNKIFPEN